MSEGINLSIILVLVTGFISYQAFEKPAMRSRLLFVPDLVKRFGQYDRFLTSGFIHADWMHLLFNMYMLYEFGKIVEQLYVSAFGELEGRIYYLLLYLGGIVVSSLPSYIKHQDNGVYSALGASGGVSGVVFSLIFFAPWATIELFFLIPIPFIIGGVLYLWYSDYMSKEGKDNIGHDAHFWGAVYGFLFTVGLSAAFRPDLIPRFFEELIKAGSVL